MCSIQIHFSINKELAYTRKQKRRCRWTERHYFTEFGYPLERNLIKSQFTVETFIDHEEQIFYENQLRLDYMYTSDLARHLTAEDFVVKNSKIKSIIFCK